MGRLSLVDDSISFLRCFSTAGAPIRIIPVHAGLLPVFSLHGFKLCKFVARSDLVLDADHVLDLLSYLVLQRVSRFVVFQTKVAHLCFCLVRIKMRLLTCFFARGGVRSVGTLEKNKICATLNFALASFILDFWGVVRGFRGLTLGTRQGVGCVGDNQRENRGHVAMSCAWSGMSVHLCFLKPTTCHTP